MSQAKRRSADMAPGLFPFMAVLLCLIGALVLILAITVTQSHASARRDSQVAMMEAESRTNTAIALSEDLLVKRDELRKQVEARREELQHVEDHLARLMDEFSKTIGQLKDLENVDNEKSASIELAKEQIDALKQEIEDKQLELDELKSGKTNKKPAFAIIPYSGKNGTTRRPIYIECTKDGILIQPEAILIKPRDLIPPGAGNPLNVALRMLRSDYEKQDRALDRLAPPPYPLLLVRPDGIEAYAYARQALADWDDQFGYELVDEDMELAFPPSTPGNKEKLVKVVEDAKRRQVALLQADPQLARKYEMRDDMWPDEMSSGHPRSSFNGLNNSAAASDEFLTENGDGWKMVQAAPSGSGAGVELPGGSHTSSAGPQSNLPYSAKTETSSRDSSALASPVGTPISKQELASAYAGGLQLPNSSNLQPVGSGAAGGGPGNLSSGNAGELVLGDAGGGFSNGSAGGLDASTSSAPGANSSEVQNPGSLAQGGPGGSASSPGGAAGSSSTFGENSSHGNSSGGSNSSGTGGGGGTSSVASNTETLTDPLDPNATQPNQSVSTSVQLGNSSSDASKPKFVNPDGDNRPIAFTAGQDWAQSKAQGKATPISRTIQIVALNDKWYVRREGKAKEFDAIINLSEGPQKVSDALAAAIRDQVDNWGLAISGGYWVPLVTVEAASDAQISVERMKILLEGSGVTMKVEPLKLR